MGFTPVSSGSSGYNLHQVDNGYSKQAILDNAGYNKPKNVSLGSNLPKEILDRLNKTIVNTMVSNIPPGTEVEVVVEIDDGSVGVALYLYGIRRYFLYSDNTTILSSDIKKTDTISQETLNGRTTTVR